MPWLVAGRGRHRGWWGTLLPLVLLAPALAEAPSRGLPGVVPVAHGRADFRVPGSRTLLIVSALARDPGPFPIRLQAHPANEGDVRLHPLPELPSRLRDGPRQAPRDVPRPATTDPPALREFTLDVSRDGRSGALPILARLRGLSAHVQIYVDARDAGRVPAEVTEEILSTLEDSIIPRSAGLVGTVADADGDGRFTVLVTGWLSRLWPGLEGRFRGADLDPELGRPYGNGCDMVWLDASLRPGPHLRTILAHEYAHAVAFSRKGRGRSGPAIEEEAWLDEALAHLAEDLHGFSRSNVDHRRAAFLAATQRYGLVIPDDHAAGLWRSGGHRGAAYLFLRWCADRYGTEDLLRALIASDRVGTDNLERATGAPFPELFRAWTVSLVHDAPPGPRVTPLDPGSTPLAWQAPGTSVRYLIVGGPPTGAVRVEVQAPEEAGLQVTAVPLPDGPPPRLVPAENSR
jgi:hypothetical protein